MQIYQESTSKRMMESVSMLIRLPLPQCFCPRGRPWSEKNSDQNSDHPRLCIYWEKEKLRPWSEFLGRENSDHGLSFGCFWGRGRRGGSQCRSLQYQLSVHTWRRIALHIGEPHSRAHAPILLMRKATSPRMLL